MGEPEFDSFEEEIAHYQRKRDARVALAGSALKHSPAAILTVERDPVFRELVIVSPDTHPSPSGPLRITTFLEDGPWGHENVKTMAEAAEVLAGKSWTKIESARDHDVIAWTSTPKFQKGAQVAALIQAGNALRYRAKTHAAKDAAAKLELAAHAIFEADPDGAVHMLEDALRRQGAAVPDPPYTSLTPNPDWVTSALATNFDLLEDKVPPSWLPRLEDVRPGPRGSVLADMKEYGCGGYGCVMPTIDPKVVLKVTTDTTEAEFAATYANDLVAPVCVRYRMVIRLAARHRGVPIHLLWRDAADRVGMVKEDLGNAAEARVNEQHRLAAEAYDALHHGMPDAPNLVQAWLAFLERGARTPGPITDLFAGMATVFRRQRILFGDVHAGNLGVVDGRWIIIDPGNIAVVDS